MSRTTTEKLLDRLNELRGLSYPQIGYTYFADLNGGGRGDGKRVYFIINENGGVCLSELNGATPRIRCEKIRSAMTHARHNQPKANQMTTPTNDTTDQTKSEKQYEVIVSNVGTVVTTHSRNEAVKAYGQYKRISEGGTGRVVGEDVTLMEDGEILFEFFSPKNKDCDHDED